MKTWVDWSPEINFWVEDGKPDPDIPWPDDWEVCGVPDRNPVAIREEDKRDGTTTLAWPMYPGPDLCHELDRICSLLEQISEAGLERWLALPDRHVSFGCSDAEMDAADMDTSGFQIPGPLLQRVRRLRIRLMIGFHPGAAIRYNVRY
jgi:hypothetical protein